jgi:APA family basic amino acid/polyamine antiporter
VSPFGTDHDGQLRDGLERGVGSPVLFAIVWVSLASAVYFALGVVVDHALGLTPFVFIVATLFFGLAAMTYVEGASLHQDRGGATVFARYAFNELWSFIAGWAILLDYLILIAVCAVSATHYAAAFWSPLDEGAVEIAMSLGIIALVAVRTMRGFSRRRAERLAVLVVADIVLQLVLVVAGLIAFFSWNGMVDPIDLGDAPTWSDLIFALGVATVVMTGLESASGLAGEVGVRGAGLRRLVTSATLSVAVVYVGIAVVAVTAIPVVDGHSALAAGHLEDPVVGIAEAFKDQTLSDVLKYTLAAAATLTLIGAANSAMLGLSRLAYALSLNRQIPSRLGRLHKTWSTPWVFIAIGALFAAALAVPEDVDFLTGIYAFGALLALTIAHASVVVLRFREPERRRPYRMPFNLRVGNADLPLPAAIGGLLSAVAWLSVVLFHGGARYVGAGWLVGGLVLYVIYRRATEKPLLERVTVPERALRGDDAVEAAYGSILVPIMGTALDDDIVQTAGRLAGEFQDDFEDGEGATIEALWVFEVPMSLPIDARLPEAQLERARAALRRAKAVGEEYHGVEVQTATVRSRRAGKAIVEQARRLGVEAVVMAAEEPSRIRGGALLGGRGGPLDNFVGEVTKYVISNAPCQVILTAPPAAKDDQALGADEPAPR